MRDVPLDFLSQRPFLSAICLPLEQRFSQIGTTLHRHKPSEFAALSSTACVQWCRLLPQNPALAGVPPEGGPCWAPLCPGRCARVRGIPRRDKQPFWEHLLQPLILLPHPATQPVLGDPWHLHPSLVAPGGSLFPVVPVEPTDSSLTALSGEGEHRGTGMEPKYLWGFFFFFL